MPSPFPRPSRVASGGAGRPFTTVIAQQPNWKTLIAMQKGGHTGHRSRAARLLLRTSGHRQQQPANGMKATAESCAFASCPLIGQNIMYRSERTSPCKATARRDGGLRVDNEKDAEEGIYKYKLVLAYDGTAYAGWQLQLSQGKATHPTVQLRLEEAICRVTQSDRRQLRMSAAGRTDAGVHAQGQVACFSTDLLLDDMRKLRASLNSLLPKDIRVYEAARVPPDFNARYLSTRKVYQYTIMATPMADPHTRHFALHIPWKLDFDAMLDAAKIFQGTHDFTQFSNKPSAGREGIDPVKTIYRLDITKDASGKITIVVDGSGFLYKMVRHLTGALIAVGSGKLTPEALEKILARGSSKPPDGSFRGWHIADAHGLCLTQVFFPAHDDPEVLMLPELLHDKHGRIVQQNIEWVEQADGSYRPIAPGVNPEQGY